MNNLKDFLIKNEDFENKNLLFITFNKGKFVKLIIKNNSRELLNKSVYKFFKNISLNNLKNAASLNQNLKVIKVFDYIFINIRKRDLENNDISTFLKEIYKYGKSGTRIFISKKNNQNIKNLLTFKNIKKKDNLNFSQQLLTYDYVYFSNISPTINKKLNPIITLILKFLSITKDKTYIRFYFCAKNTLVKYIYVPEFR